MKIQKFGIGGNVKAVKEDTLIKEDLVNQLVKMGDGVQKKVIAYNECRVNSKPLPDDLLPGYVREYLANANIPAQYWEKEIDENRILKQVRFLLGKFDKLNLTFSEKSIHCDPQKIWESSIYSAWRDIFIRGMSRSGKTFSACYLLLGLISKCRYSGIYLTFDKFRTVIENGYQKSEETNYGTKKVYYTKSEDLKNIDKYCYIVIDEMSGYIDSNKESDYFRFFSRRRKNPFLKTIFVHEGNIGSYLTDGLEKYLTGWDKSVIIDSSKNDIELTEEEKNIFIENDGDVQC